MRPSALLLTVLLACPILPHEARSAEPVPAFCTVMQGGETVEGDCRFTPRKGGSFDIHMADGRRMMGADSLSLDVTAKGRGNVRAGDDRWGAVIRQDADPACWKGERFTICARGPKDPRPDRNAVDFSHGDALAARCHMGGCNWVDQSPAREVGRGTDAVPGRLVEVLEGHASSQHDGEYPPGPPPGLAWSAAQPVRYFCSTARPAFQQPDGTWVVLPLPSVWGVTEGITTTYLHACHPGREGSDEASLKALGYTLGQPAQENYPDFGALSRR